MTIFYAVNYPVITSRHVITITTGEDVDIRSNTTWITITASFYWQKDDVNVSSGIKYKGTKTDTLTIFNAQETDEGTYTLTAYFVNINVSFQRMGLIKCKLYRYI